MDNSAFNLIFWPATVRAMLGIKSQRYDMALTVAGWAGVAFMLWRMFRRR